MSQPSIRSLGYSNDLIAHYQSLVDLPGFVLLESIDKHRGRYDIITAYPYETFLVPRSSRCFDETWANLQSRLPVMAPIGSWPFQGGAIGYFSYDFGAALMGIENRPYAGSEMPLVDIGLYDWAIVTDHSNKTVHLLMQNTQPDTPIQVREVLNRWERKKNKNLSFRMDKPFSSLISIDEYQRSFAAIHQDLQRGRAYQVNYSQPFLAEYSGDPWEMYKKIRVNNPVPYAAFLRGKEGDVLSFSPEHFLSMEKGIVHTSPIKGTSKRSSNQAMDESLREALLKSEKNRAENVMIVDLLRNDLGKFAKPGTVRVASLCEVHSFEAVHHLVSEVTAECLPSTSPVTALAASFPGGSITGAPKREAMKMISEQESFARGLYCGSIGYFSSHGRFDSNITIRTITAKQNRAYLSAGGGIVIDSNWEDEYRECFTKIEAIMAGL